jgi:hypothetical protein
MVGHHNPCAEKLTKIPEDILALESPQSYSDFIAVALMRAAYTSSLLLKGTAYDTP